MRFKIAFVAATVIALSATPMAAKAHNTGYAHSHQNNNDQQLVGGVIGAIAGGVLGSQVAGNGARTEGSVLGAVLGGAAGAAIAGNGNNNVRYNQGYNQGGFYNQNTGYYGGYQHSQPVYAQPVYQQRVYQQPVYRQPVYSQPIYVQPIYSQPVYYSQPIRRSFYSQPSISINLSSGHNRGFNDRGFRGHNGNRGRGHYSRRH